MHFQQGVTVIMLQIGCVAPGLLLLPFRVGVLRGRVADIHVHLIHASPLGLDDLVLVLLENMRVAGTGRQIGRPIRHHEIICRDEQARRPVGNRVLVDFLEPRAREAKVQKKLLMLLPILGHNLGDVVIDVPLDTLGLLQAFRRLLANDVGCGRT